MERRESDMSVAIEWLNGRPHHNPEADEARAIEAAEAVFDRHGVTAEAAGVAAAATLSRPALIEAAREAEALNGDEATEYAFDIKLLAAVRVKATSEREARRMLNDYLQAADCNFGAWPDGSPILAEASIDGEADLYEVNGEAI
jgi:hypothetical protein